MKFSAEDQILGEVDVTVVSPTGNTMHTVDGAPISPTAKLRLVQIAGDESVYLIHYGLDDRELTDTCHQSVEEALDQAEFEYGIRSSDWTFFQIA